MEFAKRLVLSLLLCLGGGWLSGIVTEFGIKDWYNHLIQPAGTPPNKVFPIVWTLLYILMALSLTLFWQSPLGKKQMPTLFFGLQLVLNFSWSFLFFGLRSPGIALFDLVLLLICVLGTIITFWRHTQVGSLLLIPYFAWITYALYLNYFIWILN